MDFAFGALAGVILGSLIGVVIHREGFQWAQEKQQKERERGGKVDAWIK